MVKKLLVGVLIMLGSVGILSASQTNISFTILPATSGDNNTDTGTTNTGTITTGTITTGTITTGINIGSNGSGGPGGGYIPPHPRDLGSAGSSGYVVMPSTGEFANVYEWGHHYGLIASENRLNDTINRVEFAQMMTTFISKVRGQTIVSNPMCDLSRYADYSKIYKGDRPYIKAACDLGLMGWNGDRTALMTKYNPYQTISRDQMATIVSRMLYGTQHDNADPINRYQGHLQAMRKAGLLSKAYPSIVESRVNILTILRRIATVTPHGTVKPYKRTAPQTGITQNTIATGELRDAYTWAKSYDITTLPSYNEVVLYTPINRGELARMLSLFSQTILGKSKQEKPICAIEQYEDYKTISPELLPSIQNACDLGIMGLTSSGTLITLFKPYKQVNRAEFGTVLSRMLYGAQYDTTTGENRYVPHLKALSDEGYIHDTSTPSLQELQGYILIILHRIASHLPRL